MIELTHLTHRYDAAGPPAVDDVSLQVAAGEFVALVGESGCGKTTTLKLINRLIEPHPDRTTGTVRVDGKDVRTQEATRLRRAIGYVFQRIGLLPHYTIAENLAVVPRLLRWDAPRIAARVDALLDLVNLPREFAARMPAALSGGQQQRVGVARALAAEPKVVLMDEPFGALDPINRDALQIEYQRLHERLGLTTVMVTHDMAEAMLLADRIAVLRSGRLLRVGTPAELMRSPEDEYVERLIQTPRRQAARLEALAGTPPAA